MRPVHCILMPCTLTTADPITMQKQRLQKKINSLELNQLDSGPCTPLCFLFLTPPVLVSGHTVGQGSALWAMYGRAVHCGQPGHALSTPLLPMHSVGLHQTTTQQSITSASNTAGSSSTFSSAQPVATKPWFFCCHMWQCTVLISTHTRQCAVLQAATHYSQWCKLALDRQARGVTKQHAGTPQWHDLCTVVCCTATTVDHVQDLYTASV